jgi:hypothetical protein
MYIYCYFLYSYLLECDLLLLLFSVVPCCVGENGLRWFSNYVQLKCWEGGRGGEVCFLFSCWWGKGV